LIDAPLASFTSGFFSLADKPSALPRADARSSAQSSHPSSLARWMEKRRRSDPANVDMILSPTR